MRKIKRKNKTICLYIYFILFLLLRWYVSYRYVESNVNLEELLDILSMNSGFTNIVYLTAIYAIFYVFILSMEIPEYNIYCCVRCTKKEYRKNVIKKIVLHAVIFSSLIVIMQIILAGIQFHLLDHAITKWYLIGTLLNVMLWSCAYAIIGSVYFLVYLGTYSKVKAAMILCIFCMLLFVLFRMIGKQILFSDIDVIRLLFLDRLNLLQYIMVMMKYIAYSYLISVISEILLNKKELIKEGVV